MRYSVFLTNQGQYLGRLMTGIRNCATFASIEAAQRSIERYHASSCGETVAEIRNDETGETTYQTYNR